MADPLTQSASTTGTTRQTGVGLTSTALHACHHFGRLREAPCSTAAHAQALVGRPAERLPVTFTWQVLPYSRVMLLVPKGWTLKHHQGATTLASGSQSRYYLPTERFAGALIQVFVVEGPHAIGPSFDLMRLAKEFIATQTTAPQVFTLREVRGRRIVTARYAGVDAQGQALTYLAAFVVERQVLTVFLAATPKRTDDDYLPVLEKIVSSIILKPLAR